MSPLMQFLKRQWLLVILIGIVLAGAVGYESPSPAHAASYVGIRSSTVYCDRIAVTYDVVNAVATDTAIITAYNTDSVVGSTTSTGTPSGTYTATVPVNPVQPAGTLMQVRVEINDGNGAFVYDIGQFAQCIDDGTEPPPPLSGGEGPAAIWNGFTDGRLNPDMAEYFSVYCENDVIRVLRANPPPTTTVTEFDLADVINLDPRGGSLTQDGVNISRLGDDITVSGHGGNLAPAYGEKRFSLSECINRNGGEPTPPAVTNNAPTIESNTQVIRIAEIGYFSVNVIDVDHDVLTITVSADNSAIYTSTFSTTLEWNEERQSYDPVHIQVSKRPGAGDQNATVVVTVTDSQGASASTRVAVTINTGSIFDWVFALWAACSPLNAPAAIVLPMAVMYTKRHRKRSQ